MSCFISHHGNSNENHNKYHYTPTRMVGLNKKKKKLNVKRPTTQVLSRVENTRILIYLWQKYKIIQLFLKMALYLKSKYIPSL